MSELTEKINDEIYKFGDMGEYGASYGLMIARDVIEEHELQHKIELNKNQQIALDWLKKQYIKRSTLAILIVRELSELISYKYFVDEPVYKAFTSLSNTQQVQVLQVFSTWVIEQEGE